MELTFLGCGDAFGSGGRFNTCFHLAGESGSFLIDCGASAMIALRRYQIVPNEIHTIVISHLHGDHFGGLPFLILDAQFYSKREAPLTIVGPPGLNQRLNEAMEVFFPGSSGVERRFEVRIAEIAPGARETFNNLTITAFEVQHACGAPPLALRIEYEDRVVAYSGDTEWTDNLIEAGRDADLFVAEALFFERQTRFHLDYASLAAHLEEIAPKRLALTHMGPDMLANRHRIPDNIVLAEDGLRLTI